MGSKNPFRGKRSPPDILAGDFVTPKRGKNCYAGWRYGEFRQVLKVEWDDTNDPYGSWVLVIDNPQKARMSPNFRTSKYNPANFTTQHELGCYLDLTKEKIMASTDFAPGDQLMAREATQYLGIRVNTDDDGIRSWEVITTPRDSHAEVEHIVTPDLNAGETVLIVKTVMKLEGLPPRPPIRRTEFR